MIKQLVKYKFMTTIKVEFKFAIIKLTKVILVIFIAIKEFAVMIAATTIIELTMTEIIMNINVITVIFVVMVATAE